MVPEHTGQKNVSRIFPVIINSNAIDRTGEDLTVLAQDASVTTGVRTTRPAPPKRKRTSSPTPTPPPTWATKQAADIQLNLRPDPYATKKQQKARERTLRYAIARKIQVLARASKRTEWRTKKEAKLERALGEDVTAEHLTNPRPHKVNKLTHIIGPSAPTQNSEQPSLEVVVLPTPLIWGFNSSTTTEQPPRNKLTNIFQPFSLLNRYPAARRCFAAFIKQRLASQRAEDVTPMTPDAVATERVRTTATRFKQYISRAIERRQMNHSRLLAIPESAPARQRQKQQRQLARKQERTTKAFMQSQDALPKAISSTPTLRQATERLKRFVVFLQARMVSKKLREMEELYSHDYDDGASDSGASDDGASDCASDSGASYYCSYKSWRSDRDKRRGRSYYHMDDLWEEYTNSYC